MSLRFLVKFSLNRNTRNPRNTWGGGVKWGAPSGCIRILERVGRGINLSFFTSVTAPYRDVQIRGYQSKFTSHTNPITRFIFLIHPCSPVSIILKRGLGIIQYNTPLPTKRGLCSVVNNRKCFDQSVYHIYKRHPEICSHS